MLCNANYINVLHVCSVRSIYNHFNEVVLNPFG
nr:MAG TPA: hypothetical protein [Caudoviricetes sp.]